MSSIVSSSSIVHAKSSTVSPSSMVHPSLCLPLLSPSSPPLSSLKVKVVAGLPKTRSGKILRGTMQKIANNEEYAITPTIEDRTVFDALVPAIQSLVAEK